MEYKFLDSTGLARVVSKIKNADIELGSRISDIIPSPEYTVMIGGVLYHAVALNGRLWTTDFLKYDIGGDTYVDPDTGIVYYSSNDCSSISLPSGWRIPNSNDVGTLLSDVSISMKDLFTRTSGYHSATNSTGVSLYYAGLYTTGQGMESGICAFGVKDGDTYRIAQEDDGLFSFSLFGATYRTPLRLCLTLNADGTIPTGVSVTAVGERAISTPLYKYNEISGNVQGGVLGVSIMCPEYAVVSVNDTNVTSVVITPSGKDGYALEAYVQLEIGTGVNLNSVTVSGTGVMYNCMPLKWVAGNRYQLHILNNCVSIEEYGDNGASVIAFGV